MKRKTFMITCPFCGTRLIDCDNTLSCYIKCKKCTVLWLIEISKGPRILIVPADYHNGNGGAGRAGA